MNEQMESIQQGTPRRRAGAPEENMEKAARPAVEGAEAEQPRRRRRAERYEEETAAREKPVYTAQPVMSSSETAREVANRYRQRQERPLNGGTTRVPVQTGTHGAAGRASRERVGYPAGRMGMDMGQRSLMRETERARLEEEARQESAVLAGRGQAVPRGQNRAAMAGRTDPRRVDPAGPGGRVPLDGRPGSASQSGAPKRRSKVLIILVILLLVIGVLLAGLLLIPEDAGGPLGQLKQSVAGMLGGVKTEPRTALSFEISGQDQMEAPTNVDFLAVTESGVTNVRLINDAGEELPFDQIMGSQENGLMWQLSWYAEEPYSGQVRLELQSGGEWTDSGRAVQVEVLAYAESTPAVEEELPVVFTTEEPTETPTPTQTPAYTLEPEPTDAENEGWGEDTLTGEYEDPEEAGEGWEDLTGEEADPEDPAEGREEDARAEAEDSEESGEGWSESAEEEQPETRAVAEGAEEGQEAASAASSEGEEDTGEAQTASRPAFTVSAAEEADPSLISTTVIYNGTKKVTEYARSDKEKIHMPVLGEYTKQKIGVLTFRNDAFRQNAAVGTVKGMSSLKIAWTAEAGSVKGSGQTYYGIGWVGQPAIVKWSKQVREQSEMYESKREKSGLKEVIVAGLDGRIYFLDLSDGTATRNAIKLGFPMKGAPSVHPGGAPYMTVGQFARKMANKTGTIGLRQYNLYLLKELSLIDGLDGKNNRPYNSVGSFETSALIDRTTGCMVTAGTNGMLYVVNLNSEFDYNAGTYSQSPSTVAVKTKAKKETDAQTAVEASVAMYDRYVYYADVGGFLRCLDTNSMTVAWAVSLGDTVESTPALDWHGEDGLDLYAATELSARKKGDAEVTCFDALTGEERWTAAFGVKKDTKSKTVSGFRASPVVGQEGLSDYVYYTVNNLSEEGQEQLDIGDETAALIALRKADGTVAWARGLTGHAYSSPVAVYDEEGRGALIQCAGDGSVLMLDGETGDELASLEIDGTIEASPAVYDGMLVIGTTEKNKNNIYGIRIE